MSGGAVGPEGVKMEIRFGGICGTDNPRVPVPITL
jgi:hypothetical protein